MISVMLWSGKLAIWCYCRCLRAKEKAVANILVIEDEPVLLGLVATTLRLEGHNVLDFCDARSALLAQGTRWTFIDLLLADVDMKSISGSELLSRLNRMGFRSPVIFMSGYPSLAWQVAKDLGGRSILEKPFTAEELRSAVRNALPKSKRRARSVA